MNFMRGGDWEFAGGDWLLGEQGASSVWGRSAGVVGQLCGVASAVRAILQGRAYRDANDRGRWRQAGLRMAGGWRPVGIQVRCLAT